MSRRPLDHSINNESDGLGDRAIAIIHGEEILKLWGVQIEKVVSEREKDYK